MSDIGRSRLLRAAALALLVLINLAVRAHQVREWLLPNVDEIVLLNTMNLPLLEGASASSAYWPAHLIIKSFFFLKGAPPDRSLAVVFGAAFILLMFATARKLAGFWPAWLTVLALTFQWYFLYISRIIEIASFIPFFTALGLYFFVCWVESRKPGYLYAFAAVSGIALNIWSPPMAYLTGAVFAYLGWLALRRRLAWRTLLIGAAVLLLTLLPFFYVLANVAHLRQEIMARYAMTANQSQAILPVNLLRPGAALQTWTQLVTCYRESGFLPFLAPLALFYLAVPAVLYRRLRGKPFFASLAAPAALIVMLIAVCPVPFYIEGHGVPLFLLLILLLLMVAAGGGASGRFLGVGSLLAIFLSSLFFAPRYFDNQQRRLVDWLDAHVVQAGRPALCVSDGAHLKFQRLPAVAGLNLQYPVFTCAPQEPFWQEHSPGDFRYVIATYEFDQEKNITARGFQPLLRLEMNNLLEAHLKHGIRIWEIQRPDAEAVPPLSGHRE